MCCTMHFCYLGFLAVMLAFVVKELKRIEAQLLYTVPYLSVVQEDCDVVFVSVCACVCAQNEPCGVMPVLSGGQFSQPCKL